MEMEMEKIIIKKHEDLMISALCMCVYMSWVSIILMMQKATMELLFNLKDSKGLFWVDTNTPKQDQLYLDTHKKVNELQGH